MTNTNWQSYGGETTLSYFVQMAGLTVQNFVSAAAGWPWRSPLSAASPGASRIRSATSGWTWFAATVYVLLPLSLVGASDPLLAGRRFRISIPIPRRPLVEGKTQTIAQGPGGLAGRHQAAGHEWRRLLQRQLGASVRESDAADPTSVEFLFILLIPAGLTYTFGKMVGDTRQGWAIFATMSLLFLVGVFICYPSEQSGQSNPGEAGRSDARDGHAAGRQYGRQGGPLRHRALRPVGRRDLRRQQRQRQQHARQLHAAGRTGAAVQYPDR